MKLLNKPKLIIGIDPDVSKCGFAVYDTELKQLTDVRSVPLFALLEQIDVTVACGNYLIRLEAGWLKKKSNWHGGSYSVAQCIAKQVGRNHEIGRQIEKYLIKQKYNYELLEPKGYSNIFKDADTFKQVTGWTKQTNEDSRASCAMVWGY